MARGCLLPIRQSQHNPQSHRRAINPWNKGQHSLVTTGRQLTLPCPPRRARPERPRWLAAAPLAPAQPVRSWLARPMKAAVAALVRSRPLADWTARFDAADCCVTPVLTWQEAREHPLFVGQVSVQAWSPVD